MRLEDIWICDEVMSLKDGAMDFRGSKIDFFGYLLDRDFPFYGTPHLISEMQGILPGLSRQVAECRSLSAECLSATLIRLAGRVEGGKSWP
jgi:hypothetical protein